MPTKTTRSKTPEIDITPLRPDLIVSLAGSAGRPLRRGRDGSSKRNRPRPEKLRVREVEGMRAPVARRLSRRQGVGPDGRCVGAACAGKLSTLVGREPVDFADAKAEARRAIVAWKDGRDARQLLPGDAPTLATMLDEYGEAAERGTDRSVPSAGPLVTTVVNGRPFGEWRAADVTREMIEAFRRQRPRDRRRIAIWRCCGRRSIGRCSAAGARDAVQGGHRVSGQAGARGGADAAPAARRRGTAAARGGRAARSDRRGARDGLPARRAAVAAVGPGARGSVPAGGEDEGEEAAARAHLDGAAGGARARRNDPAGEPLPPDAFVFGDEVGRRRRSIKTAWRLTCQRAKIVGLHFHDLRREAGSRWMDAGVPLATIQRWLGHHNISQTSTYLAASGGGDADAMRAFEQATGRLTNVDQICRIERS